MQSNIISSPELAGQGHQKIEWVRRNMPILNQLEDQFAQERPFAGKRVTVCIHLEAKTAYLALVLRTGGATVSVVVIPNQLKTMWWPHSLQRDCMSMLVMVLVRRRCAGT